MLYLINYLYQGRIPQVEQNRLFAVLVPHRYSIVASWNADSDMSSWKSSCGITIWLLPLIIQSEQLQSQQTKPWSLLALNFPFTIPQWHRTEYHALVSSLSKVVMVGYVYLTIWLSLWWGCVFLFVEVSIMNEINPGREIENWKESSVSWFS